VNVPILIFDKPCDEAVVDVTRQLEEARFQVIRTFDLQAAQESSSDQMCSDCSFKGEINCSCQMVVLLVYGVEQGPVSLVARGRKERTWFDLVVTPGQRANEQARMHIRLLLDA
jgi:hypothetical protein